MVGAPGDELIDEVALGPHDLHAVVARLARQSGTVGVVVDLFIDLIGLKRPGRKGVDRRLDGRRRHELR